MTFTVVSKKEITTDKVLKKVEKFLKNARKGMDEPQTHRMNDDVRVFVLFVFLLCVATSAASIALAVNLICCHAIWCAMRRAGGSSLEFGGAGDPPRWGNTCCRSARRHLMGWLKKMFSPDSKCGWPLPFEVTAACVFAARDDALSQPVMWIPLFCAWFFHRHVREYQHSIVQHDVYY
jgi:hypothetical protein